MIKKIKKHVMPENIHAKELLKGSSISFTLKIVALSLNYIFTLLISRNFGAETVGLYALSMTILNILATLSLFGFDNAIIKFVSQYSNLDISEIYKKAFLTTLTISLVLSALFYFDANYIAINIFHNEKFIFFLKTTSLILVFYSLLKLNSALFRGFKDVKLFSLFENLYIFLFSTILLVIAIMLNFPKTVVIEIYSISIIIVFFISILYVRKKILIFSPITHNISYEKIYGVSIYMLFASAMALIMNWTDIIMIGIFMDEASVGLYNIAYKVSVVTSIVLTSINSISAPKFAELWSKNDKYNLLVVAQKSAKLIFFVSLPIILILLLFPKWVLSFFGPGFDQASYVLVILVVGQLVNAWSGSVGYLLQMTDDHKYHQKIIMIGAILNVILNFVLIPIMGIEGAAFASTISIVFWNISFSIRVKKILGNWIFYNPFKYFNLGEKYVK